MTREEIKANYFVDEYGIIRSPGRFQAEYVYSPHFDELSGEGECLNDGVGQYASLVAVSDEDRMEFPEIDADTKFMLVTENDQGFVFVNEKTEDEAEEARNAYAEG